MARLEHHDFPAEQLTTPPCPHFEECGACQLQHLKLDFYQDWKVEQVKNLMAENGLAPEAWLPPVFIPAGTRRRVTLTAKREGDALEMGFHRYHDHSIAPISGCLLLTPALDKVFKRLPEVLLPLLQRGEQVDILLQQADDNAVDCMIIGLEERDGARLGAKQTALVAALAQHCGLRRVSFQEKEHSEPLTQVELDRLTKTSGALTVNIAPGAFLQPSAEGEEALSQAVLKALGKRSKKDKVYDLFSGCGTFSGRILELCQVHAVENDFGMSNSLKEAAKGHARFTAEARDLFKEPVSVREMKDVTAVVFDPPRAGAKEQCQKLAKSMIPLLIGVSCNPATFARDAKILLGGGYKLKSLQIFDQFIYTTHVEVVGIFTK